MSNLFVFNNYNAFQISLKISFMNHINLDQQLVRDCARCHWKSLLPWNVILSLSLLGNVKFSGTQSDRGVNIDLPPRKLNFDPKDSQQDSADHFNDLGNFNKIFQFLFFAYVCKELQQLTNMIPFNKMFSY